MYHAALHTRKYTHTHTHTCTGCTGRPRFCKQLEAFKLKQLVLGSDGEPTMSSR